MRVVTTVGIALLVLAAGVEAGAIVNITSESAARVYFDGEEVGSTPISIRDAKPGFHRIRVADSATGDVREYDFYSPESVTVVKDVQVSFAGTPGEGIAGPPPPIDQDPQVAPAHSQTAPEAAAAQDRSYEEGRRREQERQKRRTRNTLLGAAVANEILNRGSSKKTVRGVTLGGALLNELFNR